MENATFDPFNTVNGVLFPEDPNDYIAHYKVGTVQETFLFNIGAHPHHQHVNQFQIMKIAWNEFTPGAIGESLRTWWQEGDWHDSAFSPTQAGQMTVRWQADKFTGRMQFHCHWLYHQDSGMVATYHITGQEGTMWQYARTIDPTCELPSWANGDISAIKTAARGASAWPGGMKGNGNKWEEMLGSSMYKGTVEAASWPGPKSYQGRKLMKQQGKRV